MARALAGDLLVHLVSGMMFMLGINEPPTQATSVGGILRWKDGRNMPDVHAHPLLLRRPPVYMRLNLGTEMPETYRFQGPKGILEVTEFGLSYLAAKWQGLRAQLLRCRLSSCHARGLREEMARRKRSQAGAGADAGERYRSAGPDYDDMHPHLWNFFQAVRIAQPGRRGRGLRPPCGSGLPHGERIVFPQDRRCLGRSVARPSRADPAASGEPTQKLSCGGERRRGKHDEQDEL